MININEIKTEKAILAAVFTGDKDDEASLEELRELSFTAGAEVIAVVTQNRQTPDNALYIGLGKLNEIKQLIETQEADLLIFDGELTPIQLRNLEKQTNIRVIDRTMLILDIFAMRAKSNEGKLQVELAQLQYMLPRLIGRGNDLSRLGGGIGTRGPGESKLESDKRHIRRRIDSLKRQLMEVQHRRESMRKRRKKNGIPVIALVGYTNAGKSTLMNTLTNAGVLAEDKLFATLDPTARALNLPDGRKVILIDTVGFIRRLPHNLIDAFKSTLEEAAQADVILNICDGSSEQAVEHLKVTQQLLEDLGCKDKPIINIINKCDLINNFDDIPVIGKVVYISALEGKGIDKVLNAIASALTPTQIKVNMILPFDKSGYTAKIRENGVIFDEKYTDKGIELSGLIDISLADKLKDYIDRKM